MEMATEDGCAPSAGSSCGMATWALAIIMVIGFVQVVGMLGEPKTGDLIMKQGTMNGKTIGTKKCSHFTMNGKTIGTEKCSHF